MTFKLVLLIGQQITIIIITRYHRVVMVLQEVQIRRILCFYHLKLNVF